MWISIFLFQTTSKIDNILSTRVFLVDGSKLKTRLDRPIACERQLLDRIYHSQITISTVDKLIHHTSLEFG